MQAAASKAQALQAQRTKLANSYGQLLDEFNAKELRQVGNYALGRLIGKGSFGKVYLASHKLINGSKVVLKSANKDDHNLAREIHHHRQFVHPHIARLYEVIVTETLVWLVLEYCAGDELYNHLLKTGSMEPDKVQKIFTQLVGAVSYVHQKSCVHRDLKLENILLDKHENVKLVDFGFTREYEGKSSYLQTWCGTICYSAPEMIKGEKYAGEKVDVWSLGIILYALLSGELPYDDDDENATKTRILKDEPKYPDHIPAQAKDLIMSMLSKRPFIRPSLADILQHPWLAEFAPQQQAILKLQQPAPFTSDLEKDTLGRMRSAGVDIDMVIENVLAQRCDNLAGWWALLIEKEERKAKRRERKRREAEAKGLRRLSAASSRLERIAPTIQESDEHGLQVPIIGDPPRPRGRNMKRRSISDLPNLPEASATESPRPRPIDKDSVRSASSPRPLPPPKETSTSSPSLLQVAKSQTGPTQKAEPADQMQKKKHHPFFTQLAQIRQWIRESTKKARATANSNARGAPPAKTGQLVAPASHGRRISRISNSSTYRYSNSHARPDYPRALPGAGAAALASTAAGSAAVTTPHRRLSVSPAPPTPRSSTYRRTSSGLRGRKSTSSSVSSVRSIHQHQHTLSKASSTSSASTSLASPTGSASFKPATVSRSPHASSSVKVLPAPPTSASSSKSAAGGGLATTGSNGDGGGSGKGGGGTRTELPRKPLTVNTESVAAFGALPPPSPGILFAKRKRSPFKGPMLSLSLGGFGSGAGKAVRGQGGESLSRSSSQRKRSGELTICEEDEEDEDDVELVDEFSPVKPGETVEMGDER